MNKRIAIKTDGCRDIDYQNLLSFYSLNINGNPVDCRQSDTVILDMQNMAAVMQEACRIRQDVPAIPLLIVLDYGDGERLEFLGEINGTGPVSLLDFRPEHPRMILDMTQDLLDRRYSRKHENIAIVLPLFNESERMENVRHFFSKLQLFVHDSCPDASVHFVDDGSVDNTRPLIDGIVADGQQGMDIIRNNPFFTAQSLMQNTRKAGTYIQGLRSIEADILIFVDSDDSFEVEDIARMVNIIRDGYYDMVVGTKDMSAEGRMPIRRLVSLFKRILTRPLLPRGVSDSQTGLKVMRSVVARKMFPHLHQELGLALDLEMLYLARKEQFRVYQMPVTCYDRDGSHVNIIRDSLRFLKSMAMIPLLNSRMKKVA